MLQDGFKASYINVPFAYYKESKHDYVMNLISHHHRAVELIAMTEGNADFYIDNVRYSLAAGDVLVIPPYCMHRADIAPQTSYDCACFDVSILWDKSLSVDLENGNLTVAGHLSKKQAYTPTINNYVRHAVSARQNMLNGWEMEVIGNLSLMFSELKKHNFFIKSGKTVPEHKFAKDTYRYIKEHFNENITSRTAAEALHINNSYFCRLFKKTFGRCFAQYLIDFRIANAKTLLTDTPISVSDIAIKTGFCSFSYFSKVFKKSVGVTPSEYRKQNRQP
ncbi:MAG: AraC family transcriptional regulator [Clostridia bacterium]|nr:AraC family transcriptional regulator [Clostridia bacterium]